MEDMEEGHLPVFLPEDKDHRVYQLNELREEEEPGHSNHPESLRAVGVVHGVTTPGISAQPARHQELIDDV